MWNKNIFWQFITYINFSKNLMDSLFLISKLDKGWLEFNRPTLVPNKLPFLINSGLVTTPNPCKPIKILFLYFLGMSP